MQLTAEEYRNPIHAAKQIGSVALLQAYSNLVFLVSTYRGQLALLDTLTVTDNGETLPCFIRDFVAVKPKQSEDRNHKEYDLLLSMYVLHSYTCLCRCVLS